MRPWPQGWRLLCVKALGMGRLTPPPTGNPSREAHSTFGWPQRHVAGDLFFAGILFLAMWLPCDSLVTREAYCTRMVIRDLLQVIPCLIKALAISLGPRFFFDPNEMRIAA